MLMFGLWRSSNELTAMILPTSSSRMYRLIPPTIETTAMRKVTPIVTPRRVKKLLSFWTLIWLRARRTASRRDKGPLGDSVLRHEPLPTVVTRNAAVTDDD